MVKYLSFHNSSFCLKILLKVNGKAHRVTHPLFGVMLKLETLGSFFFRVGDQRKGQYLCSLPNTTVYKLILCEPIM
jgi:hypothetical protein